MALGAATRKKNSGVLRYTFGMANPVTQARAGQFGSLVGGGVLGTGESLVVCLGANADVDPDSDDQVFGECPGHAAITGATGTLFAGNNVVQRDAIDPASALIVGRYPAYVPARTKLDAYFQLSDAIVGASTVPAEAPVIIVQSEVVNNRIFRAGVQDPDQGGLGLTGQFIGSIRVALQNIGASTSSGAGVLRVELQHSEHDIVGGSVQDMTMVADIPID